MKVWIQSVLVLGVLTISVLARSVSAIRIGTADTGIPGPIGNTGDTGSSFPPSVVLSIESGGTNSSTALMGSKLIVSNSNQIVEGTSLLNPTFDSIILEDSILIGATRLQPSSSSSSSLSSSSSSRFVLRIPFETGISSNEVLLDQGDQIVQGRKTFAGSWLIESNEERCLLVTGSLQVNDLEMLNATLKIDNTIESKLSTNTLQLEESGFKIRDTGNFFELGADFQMNFENRNGIRFTSTGGQMILASEPDQSRFLTFGPNSGAHSTWQFRPTKENQTIQLRAPSDSEFVMTEGNTVLQQLKTFTNIGALNTIPVPIEVLSETGQMVFGGASGTQSIVVQGIPTVGIQNYKIPHSSNDSFFVMSEGDMEVFGTKTFTNLFPRFDQGVSIVTTGGNQIILGPTGSRIALNFEISSSGTNPISFQETVPNVHTGAEFVLADGDSNIRGDKVFTDVDAPNQFNVTGLNTLAKVNNPLRLTATDNQLVLGTGLTKTINCPTPSAPRIYSIPVDNKTDSNFVMTEGAQSLDNVLFAGNISHEAVLQVPSISIGNLITGKTYRACWRLTTQPVITTDPTLLIWNQSVYNKNWPSWPLFPKTGLYLVSMSLEYNSAGPGKGHGICCPFPYDFMPGTASQVWGTTDINSESLGPLTASGFFEVNNLATQQFYSYGQLSGYADGTPIQLTDSCVVEISLLTEYG
jgi:hypothetical protein